MRRQLIASALCAIISYLGSLLTVGAVERINGNDPASQTQDAAPVGPGPLRLAKLFHQRMQIDFRQLSMVSPDGRAIMYLQGGSHFAVERKLLHVARLDTQDGWSSYALNMGALWQFGGANNSIPAYGWASDSSGIWTATREEIGPGGISGSGLQPLFISLEDGSIRLFDPPRHEAGPLDGLLWAGGDGLALAYFGARGPSYQPQRHDRHPTFAMIDAKRAAVLDTLPFDVFKGLKDAYYIANVNNAAVTRLQNGKLRALLSALDQWVVWTQGEPPHILASPYPDRGERHNKMVISRDGSRLLVARLRCDAGTVDVETGPPFRRRPLSPACKPVESVVAALYDLDTGHQLWDVRATVNRPGFYPNPAISEDGRYALVGLPYEGTDAPAAIALVSMSDGKVVQRIRPPGSGPVDAIGFLGGDRGIWIHDYIEGSTALYAFDSRAQ
ncbi:MULTISPECIES: hypothetical protein [Bradyrhizobium]|uniref:hypothetical protein n=1 Tax=Bradyrhizobium TaxID=374 RepID=UPI000413E65C|nr:MULTISPECIES: hypothetical protein [Bradyrhizobium]QOG17726.1 hypothetical protein FOM02_10590 [Bradyrhizobium sp. SEMIA]UFW45700.1 hypothetical protein BaraCB756_25610 [Bradyrhizobium arachidis]